MVVEWVRELDAVEAAEGVAGLAVAAQRTI